MNKKSFKILFIISIIGNLLLCALLVLFVKKQGGVNYVKSVLHISYEQPYNQNPQYVGRTGLFDQINIPEDSIVFVGDSLTQRSLWNEVYNSNKMINRGIESDTTEGVLHRLDVLAKAKPKKIFLMIGINDLRFGKEVNSLSKNYSHILKIINKESPNTEVYVQSILPVNNSILGNAVNNDDVVKANEEIKELAKEDKYTYIDLYSKVSEENQLKSDITVDGIHLNGKGYRIWKDSIDEYIK